MARLERSNKRLWILCLILIVLLVGSNIAWLSYEAQFQEVTTTTVEQEVETEDGGDAIVNGTGEMTINGKGEAESNHN